MASATPVVFPNITAIETMMAGLGNVRCKSLGIGRQDNYNHVIHRPRDAHQDPKKKTIVGRIYQHRVFTVNQPNGRVIWVFERSSDDMLFLISPRKGPLAYKVWLNDQTFSQTLWLYGQNFQVEEKAAELRGPSDLQQWLRANRPQDAGTTGEYVNYKAHVAQLATSSQQDKKSTGQAIVSLNNEADSLAISSAVDKEVEPEKVLESIVVNQSAVAPIAVSTSKKSKAAPKKKPAPKEKPAAQPRKTPIPAPSSRSLRSSAKAETAEADTIEVATTKAGKRTADDAELDGEDKKEIDLWTIPLPELFQTRPERHTTPVAKPKPKKLKYTPVAPVIISEKTYENHCKGLLSSWFPPAEQDSFDEMDLEGMDFVPQIRVKPFTQEFLPYNKKTLIRYGAAPQDVFGGPYSLEGQAVTIEVAVPKAVPVPVESAPGKPAPVKPKAPAKRKRKRRY